MIVGPGNVYVAEAKRQLFGRVGIDLLAGPTEILVLADAEVFLGANATVVYGDKGIGMNQVLPTGKAARYTGGLWVGKFLKTVTWQIVTEAGNAETASTMAAIAEAENMKGHALTARMRMEGEKEDLWGSGLGTRRAIQCLASEKPLARPTKVY
jgi:histidinol dehydrogenase